MERKLENMAPQDDLLKTRFLLNMGRISSLVHLVCSNEALRSTAIFRSLGARADILRLIVVFLHATFEVVLRSHLPERSKDLNFYSGADLDKALKLSGIEARPFRALYPPLTQMAKRRNRIVHGADLSKRADSVSEVWGVADDWQLIMWLMAVAAFYYQLRISINAASELERTFSERYRKAMLSHVDFGNQLIAFTKLPTELQKKVVEDMVVTLERITSTLSLDVSGQREPDEIRIPPA